MTEPVREFKLPDPCFPAVNRVQADPPFPTDGDPRPLHDQEPITWTTGAAHPLIGETSKVVRMYLMPECQGVEIYCLTDKKTPDGRDANIATRHTIPWSRIRDVEELMDPETFIAAIEDAESEGDDGSPRAKSNGAAAAS